MGVIADYDKHKKGVNDCACYRCCLKHDTKARRLMKLLEYHITPFDIIGIHPCSWKSESLYNMSDKEFDKKFGELFKNEKEKK